MGRKEIIVDFWKLALVARYFYRADLFNFSSLLYFSRVFDEMQPLLICFSLGEFFCFMNKCNKTDIMSP
jgi:hypothetical protein